MICSLMPSRYEPCGLNQMCTKFEVRHAAGKCMTGGLADTVVNATLENLADGPRDWLLTFGEYTVHAAL